MGFITHEQMIRLANEMNKSVYGEYLTRLLRQES